MNLAAQIHCHYTTPGHDNQLLILKYQLLLELKGKKEKSQQFTYFFTTLDGLRFNCSKRSY